MAYNMSWMDNSTTMFDYYVGINNNLNGIPVILLLISIFLVTMFLTRNQVDTMNSFGYASFVTSLFAALLWFMGLIHWGVVILLLMMTIGVVLAQKFG